MIDRRFTLGAGLADTLGAGLAEPRNACKFIILGKEPYDFSLSSNLLLV
jgi:hypothetical protein